MSAKTNPDSVMALDRKAVFVAENPPWQKCLTFIQTGTYNFAACLPIGPSR